MGKTAVMGMKDRATNRIAARVVVETDKARLQGFVKEHGGRREGRHGRVAQLGGASEPREGPPPGRGVRPGYDPYERRAHKGVYHNLSPKDLERFAGCHSIRELDALEQIHHVVAGLVGRRLMYRDLVAD